MPFSHIDHPLTELSQAVIVFYMVRLFIAIRHGASPLPQILLITAFIVLTNLVARIFGYHWFYISDIIEYGSWGVATAASYYSVQHRKAEEAELSKQAVDEGREPPTPLRVPDFFDRFEHRITWIVGSLVVALLVTAYLRTYSEKQDKNAQLVVVADSAVVAVKQAEIKKTKEFEQQTAVSDSLDQLRADSILAVLTSVSAAQGQILKGQTGLVEHINKKSAQTRATVRAEVKKTAPKPNTNPIKPTPPSDNQNPSEPTWFDRLRKRVFGRNTVSADTVSYSSVWYGGAPGDTLLLP